MDNIVKLGPKLAAETKNPQVGQVNEAMVEGLEGLLEDAKAGRIRAGAFVVISHENKVGSLLIDHHPVGAAFQLLAGMELLKHDAMHALGVITGDEDDE